ncbi:uncharacterized protein LY89DRAFT_740498 [Mollisia scopiformis]|uniref:Uncharacterized protein n=1 Tax=Mollisia scopiformis TaxID=149040 RepID=A0A132BCE8_MOLSC|nr:uncharacterized protein LY89DRAFT_740498 [Mollisia scopiformis]KUJ10102.1 hypothetical protein LY89DRAFT_740498 [Mollisia scopiformis]
MSARPVWSTDDLVSLLAWLDFSIHQGINFADTIEKHLAISKNISQSDDYPFTKLQIQNKLLGCIRGQSVKLATLLKVGSSCILRLDEATRHEINTTVQRYTDNPSFTQQSAFAISSARGSAVAHFREACQTGSSPKSAIGAAELSSSAVSRRHDAPLCSNEDHNQLREQHCREIDLIRKEWQRESSDYLRREKQLRQRETELSAKIIHLEMARDSRMALNKDPLEYQLYLKDKQIWDSDQRIRKMQEQMRFTSKNASPTIFTDLSMLVDRSMKMFEAELGSILHGHHIANGLQLPTQQSRELYNLVQSVHGCTDERRSEGQRLRTWILKFEPEAVIKTLTLAALREWVFHSGLLAYVDKDSQLLHAYRDAIMVQDGWRSLRNLEITAYSSLIESHEFQQVFIPKRSAEFASRLTATLAILFPSSHYEAPNRSFESWGDTQEVCDHRHSRLIDIFQTALKLKAATVTVDRDYEFIVYPPRTSLPLNHISQKELTWLQASMRTYELRASGPSGQLMDALVRPENFVVETGTAPTRPVIHESIISSSEADVAGISPGRANHRATASRNTAVHSQEAQRKHPGANVRSATSPSVPPGGMVMDSIDHEISSSSTASDRELEATSFRELTTWKIPTCDICKATFSKLSNLQSHQENRLAICALKFVKIYLSFAAIIMPSILQLIFPAAAVSDPDPHNKCYLLDKYFNEPFAAKYTSTKSLSRHMSTTNLAFGASIVKSGSKIVSFMINIAQKTI